ncbi:hypothetical protein ACHAXR_012704 [Thalassiosira sp. AJA248-18]
MVRKVGLIKRSKTEGVAASVTSSASKKPKRKFPLKRLRRSKSAPSSDQDGGQTESIRSDELRQPPISMIASPRGENYGRGMASVDDGSPSSSTLTDLQRVLNLIQDERHLVAHDLYLNAKRRIHETLDIQLQQQQQQPKNKKNKVWWKTPESSNAEDAQRDSKNEYEKAWLFLQRRHEEFQALENRANLFTAAKENLSIDDDWIHAQTLFGVTTSYRREADGSLSVKIEGELHSVPLFEQLVVLRECDLYHTWAPFMSQSKKLAQLDKLDVVAWYSVGVPLLGLTRDACYRAVGCDCMKENGSVLLVAVGLNDTEEHGVKDALKEGKGGDRAAAFGTGEERIGQGERLDSNLVDTTNSSFLARDAILSTLEIPPIPEGLGRGRMTIRNFSASIDILTPTAARTKMVVNVDPNLHLIPQFMIDFCMKRMCGILLSRLQVVARRVVKDPIKNAHARRMREDVRFYRDWLFPKFQMYCNELGWQMPKVGAFEIEEDDLQAEGMGWIDDNIENAPHLCQPDDDASYLGPVSRAGTMSPSSNSTASPTFLRFRRAEPPEAKIAAARLRAAKLLQPDSFSESKVHRLNELKVAKMRAEERLRAKTLGSSSAESVSSCGTLQTLQDLDAEDDLVTRYALIFISSFLIQAALLLLRRYSLLNMTEWTSLADGEALNFIMIVLQAIALWSLLNSATIYAFDNLDFGQKRLVANMNFGKRLFVKKAEKCCLIAAISVATLSCAFGLASGSIFQFCWFADIDALSSFSWWWKRQPRTDFRMLLATLNISGDNTHALENAFFNSIEAVATFSRHVGAAMSWCIAYLEASAAFTEFFSRLSSTRWGVCESRAVASEQWGSRALNISSFITLRIGVFVLALMLMGHLLLPRPKKKSNKRTKKTVDPVK